MKVRIDRLIGNEWIARTPEFECGESRARVLEAFPNYTNTGKRCRLYIDGTLIAEATPACGGEAPMVEYVAG